MLLGGVIVDLLSWRWILFINLPIGLATAFFAQRMVVEGRNAKATRNFDLAGALSATVGLSLVVFGIVRTTTSGWGDAVTLVTIAAGVALLAAFLLIEGKFAEAPLMPLRLFHSRSLSAANVIIVTVGGSTFAMWFFYSLYLQEVEGHSPLVAGLLFLPMTVAIIAGSQLASRNTLRYGAKRLLIFGMTLLAAGLLLFSDITVGGSYLAQGLLPSLLVSFGMPFAFIPATIVATSGVAPQEAGLASGVVNTSRMFGGALGLAVLATVASSRTNFDLHHPTAAIHSFNQALVDGFQIGFLASGAIALVGVLVAVFITPSVRVRTTPAIEATAEAAAAAAAIEL